MKKEDKKKKGVSQRNVSITCKHKHEHSHYHVLKWFWCLEFLFHTLKLPMTGKLMHGAGPAELQSSQISINKVILRTDSVYAGMNGP